MLMSDAEVAGWLDTLESHEFAASVNVTSNLDRAHAIIRASEPVDRLVAACKIEPSAVNQVLNRTKRLVGLQVDFRYESPWDIALTAHLLLLKALDQDAFELGIAFVQRAPQTWWARRTISEGLARANPNPDIVLNVHYASVGGISKEQAPIWTELAYSSPEHAGDHVWIVDIQPLSKWSIYTVKETPQSQQRTSHLVQDAVPGKWGQKFWTPPAARPTRSVMKQKIGEVEVALP